MHHPGSNAPCITLAGARGWCAGGGLLWLHKAWGHVAARDQCPGRISGEGPLQKPFSCLGFPKDKCILVGLPSTCKPNSRELLICWQRTTLDLIWQNIMINLSSWFTIQILSCKSSLSLPFKVHWISLTKDQLPWSCPPCCSAALLGAVWGPIGARSRTSWSTIVGSKSGTFVVNLDMGEVHKNREFPGAYLCWLCVADSTLPNKGTAHRALRGKDVDPPPAQINQQLDCHQISFLSLWTSPMSKLTTKVSDFDATIVDQEITWNYGVMGFTPLIFDQEIIWNYGVLGFTPLSVDQETIWNYGVLGVTPLIVDQEIIWHYGVIGFTPLSVDQEIIWNHGVIGFTPLSVDQEIIWNHGVIGFTPLSVDQEIIWNHGVLGFTPLSVDQEIIWNYGVMAFTP